MIDNIQQLINNYNKHLFDGVLSFWDKRTKDTKCGGYITAFDKRGQIIDYKKYMWLQCRQLWMFSAIYNNIDRSQKWLDLATIGYNFIIKHGYDGNGRWNYCLSRQGDVLQGTISIYTDMFALAALSEYAYATKDNSFINIIKDTFDNLNRNINDPEFVDVFTYKADNEYIRHGVYSIALNAAYISTKILGLHYTRKLIELCLNKILYVFAKDENKILFESLSKEGEIINDPEGRLINPGHILQSAWFCIEASKQLDNDKYLKRGIEIARWGFKLGYDKDFGGILSFLDMDGHKPQYTQWHKNKKVLWDDKIWWANAEALYSLLLVAVYSKEKKDFDIFLKQNDWCMNNFYDKDNKEWYTKLNRDGTPSNENKGNSCGIQKCAYHLPRALMKIIIQLNKYKREVKK